MGEEVIIIVYIVIDLVALYTIALAYEPQRKNRFDKPSLGVRYRVCRSALTGEPIQSMAFCTRDGSGNVVCCHNGVEGGGVVRRRSTPSR